MDLKALQKDRDKLAHRRRRMIMNNDGLDFMPLRWDKAGRPTSVEEFLGRRTKGLAGTLADTISYGVMPPGLGCVTYNTKIADIVRRDWKGVIPAPGGWNHPDVLLEGKDCIEIVMDFCRRHNIEMWVSIRMNGTRDLWPMNERTPWNAERPERRLADPPDMGAGLEEKTFLISEGALEHPERWLARGSCGIFHAVDYGRQDVRDKMFEILADICERYDVDGIELDFLRAPIFFRANAQGEPDVGQENRDKMTGLMRRVREMTEHAGLRRGRPVLVATRVPDDVEVPSALGLEIPVWLKEGLTDILIAGAAWRLRPWNETVELGHRYGVPVYANPSEEGAPCNEFSRGRALAAWASGADGIYTFNEFDPESPVWNELGDPEKLLQLDRITTVDNAKIGRHMMSHMKRLPGLSRFLVKPPRLPLRLPEGREKTFEFTAGEDGARLAQSATPHASLRVQFHNIEDDDKISLALNSHSLDELETHRDCPRPGWIVYRLDPSFLRWGENSLAVTLTKRDPRATEPLALADLQLHVTAHKQAFARRSPPIREACPQANHLEIVAFLITETDILPPPGKVSAQRQWLLDELNFARPRVPGVRRVLEAELDYPPDPVEKPLPGWSSLAILFDADKLVIPCEKDLILAFLGETESHALNSETALYAGYVAGTPNLAAVLVRSRSVEDLEYVARRFGDCYAVRGPLPLSIRFLRAENDGHLIARAFALVLRGMLKDGAFMQECRDCSEDLVHREDLTNTTWDLA